MKNNSEFENVYLKIINNDEIINESFGKNLATAALIGSTLLGATSNVNAASTQKYNKLEQVNNSSKQNLKNSAFKLSADELFLAKVLYSEASTISSFQEHLAIRTCNSK